MSAEYGSRGEVITVSGLTKHYGSLVAVDGLSLDIRQGEIYGFLGLNGAGKTTTIRMLLGMIRPAAGTVSLFGTAIRPGRNAVWRKIGYMVEAPHAYPDLTVRENLEIIRRLRHLSDPGTVDEVIEQLGLTREAEKKAGTLSMGNAQRLGLAKAFIHRPELLILDEPANGLDPAGIVEVRNLLRRLAAREGVTIFMSSHILSEVSRLAGRIGVVHKGRLVRELDAGEIAAQEQQRLTVGVLRPGDALPVLIRAGFPAVLEGETLVLRDTRAIKHPEEVATLLVNAHCPPCQLAVEHGDLESFFLDLVGRKGTETDDEQHG